MRLNAWRIVRRGLLAFGVTLASAACAAPPTCTLTKIEEWPVRSLGHYVVVDGTANGQPIGVMLDTGSTRSLILRSAAQRLDLSRRQSRSYRMFGVGGESPVETARIETFSIGGRSARAGS
jgi:predicted aspartyl protease